MIIKAIIIKYYDHKIMITNIAIIQTAILLS